MAWVRIEKVKWLDNFKDETDDADLLSNDEYLKIPDVHNENMNNDQKFAFNLVMHTLVANHENCNYFEPLRLIVAGTAGSGKSYLINCLVKAIRLYTQRNNSV